MGLGINHALAGGRGPGSPGIKNLSVINLGMLYRPNNAELDSFLKALSLDESPFLRMEDMALESIPQVIAERCNARELDCVFLQRPLPFRQCAWARGPAFAVNQDLGINRIQGTAHRLHRFEMMEPHQVKAETGNVVLLRPIRH